MEDGLRWLASGMKERGSIFAVELLQPEWLTSRQLLQYTIGSRVGGATAVTVSIGAVVCLGGLVLAPAGGGMTGPALASVCTVAMLLVTAGAAVAMGLLAGLFYALLGYHALRRSRDERRRERGMAEEWVLFWTQGTVQVRRFPQHQIEASPDVAASGYEGGEHLRARSGGACGILAFRKLWTYHFAAQFIL
jgi:hypothetical protein